MTMLLNILSHRNATNSLCKVQFVYQLLVRNTKYRNPMLYKFFHSSSKCTFRIKNTRECKKQLYNDLRNVNTNVQNNVILYKNKDTYDFIVLKLLFYGWVFCNTLVAVATYNPKYITTWHKDVSWAEYVMTNGASFIYFVYSTIIGPLGSVALYLCNQRFVKYIILHKGGKNVSILTNHLFKKYDTITLPLAKVKITLARQEMKSYLPMKIQGRRFYFILDGQGKFLNEKLFDYTVGNARRW
ncbi:transmembrane protein 223 [Bombus affinis]|uniref:transmembrane protein 223 n=1 Tax=Bombus affinis TaxID=309941 RepID=UPI0021B7D833|nr:transmembrane protein 223 [Bombus affinis]XP_050598265.1 transmembrane protein 223 [Bombus affinis]XP_050598269.1 transmembrane protein 223 [Bombus affinis]XP_050598275.1 transmembrane protein 223 [Bombus affinis]